MHITMWLGKLWYSLCEYLSNTPSHLCIALGVWRRPGSRYSTRKRSIFSTPQLMVFLFYLRFLLISHLTILQFVWHVQDVSLELLWNRWTTSWSFLAASQVTNMTLRMGNGGSKGLYIIITKLLIAYQYQYQIPI